MPQSLRSAVAPLTDKQLETPYRPGGWTVRQLVHHVADSHMNAYTRVRLALTEDSPTIFAYQENRWAELEDARVEPVSTSLDLLSALHVRWVRLFSSLAEQDWKRSYMHPVERPAIGRAGGHPLRLARPSPHRTRHPAVCAHGLVETPLEIREKAEFSPTELARLLEQFFSDYPRAALLEDGRVLFEMAASHYSISAEHGRCVLHLWSEERNIVRTVVGLEARKETLRIRVRRLGTQRPQSLEVVRERDLRTPATRALSRSRYLLLLERLLSRHFNEYKLEGLRSAMDLEHSFGPAYARGLLVRGQQCWALIGVNAEESPAIIDGVLTLGILWLAYCRDHHGGKRVCQGLKVFLPAGCGSTTRARMAWLNRELAQWELYEVNAASEDLLGIDTADQGNLKMRLVHAFNPQAAMERAQDGVTRILRLLPPGMQSRVTVAARSANEVVLSLYGLEFARVRQGFVAGSFERQVNVTFGAGANETPLLARD